MPTFKFYIPRILSIFAIATSSSPTSASNNSHDEHHTSSHSFLSRPSPSSSWYLPIASIAIKYDKQQQVPPTTNNNNPLPKYYAVRWPHDSIHAVLDRTLSNGTSPFDDESIVILYPDDLLYDFIRCEYDDNDVDTTPHRCRHRKNTPLPPLPTTTTTTPFWNLYDERSLLHYDTQLSIVAASSTFQNPRVLVFGAGYDAPLLCEAIGGYLKGRVVFVEEVGDDEGGGDWVPRTREALRRMTTVGEDDGGTRGRCEVWEVRYDTTLREWASWIGFEEELARSVIDQFPRRDDDDDEVLGEGGGWCQGSMEDRFDVILVDGPVGSHWESHGRMASLSAASRLIRKDGKGVVFVDDADRLVEMIWAGYLFRPTMGREAFVKGWGNTRKT